jgi:hypothetical protein
MKRPAEPLSADHPIRVNVTEALRAYLVIDKAIRSHPQGYKSSPPPDNEEGRSYLRLQKRFVLAHSLLWEATDFEYEEDGFRDKCWNWRYWKVMARKCTFYLDGGPLILEALSRDQCVRLFHADPAAATMRRLHEAELEMVKACGLESLYRSPCSYLQDQFPNLKRET